MSPAWFDSISEGFDYCREVNHPVIVEIYREPESDFYKLFPSGRAQKLTIEAAYGEKREKP